MSTPLGDDTNRQKPLRVWPGVLAAVLLFLSRYVAPTVLPDALDVAIIGAAICTLAIAVWWIFFSRAPWIDRLGAVVLMALALLATSRVVHASISNGMMGMMLPVFAIPVLGLGLVASVAASRRLSSGGRRASMVAAILLVCAAFTLLRTGGVTGSGASDLHWRWTQTPEERLLARVRDEPLDAARNLPPDNGRAGPAPAASPAPAEPQGSERRSQGPAGDKRSEPNPDRTVDFSRGRVDSAHGNIGTSPESEATPGATWPGFRGPARDGVVRGGARISTDWTGAPPVELWHREVGPGWSSFAVRGDRLYTQEQRGEAEIVASYRVSTGDPVWRHRDPVRFWESNGGAGPRATPTLANNRVYTFGATGILNALDPGSGAVVWSRNVASDADKKVPEWGFASPPPVIEDVVIVSAGGKLAAYDASTGRPRWFGPAHSGSYSSPQLATIDGIAQVLQMTGAGVMSIAPGTGALLWEGAWAGSPIVQPAVIGDHDILISTADMMGGMGIRRLSVAHEPSGWTVAERWTSAGLKPYFNDFVVHKGHAFGFDGSILSCIDLQDGKRKWKGGRYGNGQLVLLPDQDLLLVLSEDGELAVVAATSDQFTELARFAALEGKTWNHPVLVDDVLLVRNDHEMAAFRLSRASR